MHGRSEGVAEIHLHALTRDAITVSFRLAGHFVDERNAFGFRRKEVIKGRRLFKKLSGTAFSELRITQHNEGSDAQRVGYGKKRQVARESGDFNGVMHDFETPKQRRGE